MGCETGLHKAKLTRTYDICVPSMFVITDNLKDEFALFGPADNDELTDEFMPTTAVVRSLHLLIVGMNLMVILWPLMLRHHFAKNWKKTQTISLR